MPQAAIPIAAEAAVASTMTAAEIAAAEAAAAAAAEAAAVAAAEQAAAAAATEAATTAAAEQAATQAATQAAAQTATPTGLEQLLQPTTAPVTSPAPVQTAPVQPAFNPPPAAQPSVAPPAPVAPPPPTAPPPVQEVIPRSQGFIDSTTRMANPGFDAGGFENLSGIETLAKEVGAQTPNMQGMQGMQTMTSGYGAGAPPGSSVLPSMPVGSPPAPGIDQLVQPNLSGMGSNLPPPAPVMPPPAAPPIEPGGQSLYGPNGVATGNPSPPPNTPTDVTYGAGQSRITTNPADLLNQPSPASDAMAGIKGLYNDFKAMPLKDKALTGMMASSAYQMLNPPKPYEPKKYKSTFKPGLYSGFNPTPPTPYQPQYAHGGLADLGGYSDGGRMLKGPGDGMSDDIPATIANKQPARLANEEFVIPADVVSHLGNGSSEAGAKQLYKMMDRVRKARTGNKKQGKQINPEKYLA
jgi:hypothetical protein